MSSQNADNALTLIEASLTNIRCDPEFALKTSRGIGLRYAESVLSELFEDIAHIDSSGAGPCRMLEEMQ